MGLATAKTFAARMSRWRRLRSLLAIPGVATLRAIALIGATDALGQAAGQTTSDQRAGAMKICIDIEGAAMTGVLEENATARDFASLLPLTVTLEDYNATEKITDLPKKLPTEGAPAGFAPSVGDITYYAPWGNLAIFYRDFRYSSGLIKLGAIEPGEAALKRPGSMRATIELVKD